MIKHIRILFLGASALILINTFARAAEPKVNCGAEPVNNTVNKTGNLISHDKAVLVLNEWMRDPFITLGPDNWYYMTCTRLAHTLHQPGIEMWRSKNLMDWEDLGLLWKLEDSKWMPDLLSKAAKESKRPSHLWAPELLYSNDHWDIVFTTSNGYSDLLVTKGKALKGPFNEPVNVTFGKKHDPSLFVDDDGTKWLVWACTKIAPLKEDLNGIEGKEILIGPSDRKMGHEGCFILKIQGKYVLFGTAWSTDIMRHGSYNLYYCTSDSLKGPYGPRKFAGRFLGHGTIFKDKQDRWWCTAFLNGDYVSPEYVAQNGLDSSKAQTINKQGLTLVPMDIHKENGDIVVRSIDPDYALPGKDEIQKF